MSMDSGGKVMWARHSELQQANLKRGCRWVSKTWAAVRFSLRISSTAPMGGETPDGGDLPVSTPFISILLLWLNSLTGDVQMNLTATVS
ncbi:hypothetical protein Q5P01_009884 [Channa striata]|uniref:Uncharacterized protein n=1 Tax=Channa striata TaxID=64152 RepID=A0AA88N3G6_CHASR|nr:hypothetical protein Q5P01_009884 [Channa striata]